MLPNACHSSGPLAAGIDLAVQGDDLLGELSDDLGCGRLSGHDGALACGGADRLSGRERRAARASPATVCHRPARPRLSQTEIS
jgi:hypothetical protein